ncbi:MAG: hypothetical protein ACI9KE_003626 [Polyangiales bacterium]|jgi:hypothetical protein
MSMDDEIGTGTRWAAFAMIVGAVMVVLYFLSGDSTKTTMAERIERSADSNQRRARRGGTSSSNHDPRARRNDGTFAPAVGDSELDPQQRAYRRSFSTVPDAGALPPFVPSLHVGRLASVTGDAPAEEGARCEVRVLPVAANIFNCVVRVMCDGVVLYPDGAQAAGYAPCSVENGIVTRAQDEDVTSADGDPAMHVDLAARHVRVTDDGPLGRNFSATIELRPI